MDRTCESFRLHTTVLSRIGSSELCPLTCLSSAFTSLQYSMIATRWACHIHVHKSLQHVCDMCVNHVTLSLMACCCVYYVVLTSDYCNLYTTYVNCGNASLL